MILDRLSHAERYHPLHPLFARAFHFLRTVPLTDLSAGDHTIEGESLYVSIARREGAPPAEAVLEAHRKYVDIHYVIAGIDTIGWKPVLECSSVRKPYEEKDDVELFDDPPASWASVEPGAFAIFFPGEAHAPMISSGFLHKAVVKVKLI